MKKCVLNFFSNETLSNVTKHDIANTQTKKIAKIVIMLIHKKKVIEESKKTLRMNRHCFEVGNQVPTDFCLFLSYRMFFKLHDLHKNTFNGCENLLCVLRLKKSLGNPTFKTPHETFFL